METAKRLGGEIKRAINKRYRLLEIELDGVFGALLLLKKKKYAAITLEVAPDGTISREMELKVGVRVGGEQNPAPKGGQLRPGPF